MSDNHCAKDLLNKGDLIVSAAAGGFIGGTLARHLRL